ncbi:hypothetical protein M9Y10_012212 [Tritrichomonas musculus]|uniref:Protein kinase domain-containing protein n=1 Tax=Tritrichomonas musculus TaxID=1915356 RepID=A0ABR2IDN0_9EUKA
MVGSAASIKYNQKIQRKKYAAKVIDCHDSLEQCNKTINREVGIMITCNHPTIIDIIGYSKKDVNGEYNATIVMNLMKNGSLAHVIEQIRLGSGPIEYSNTTRQIILIGVARGMKYLHYRNIIHRYLKTENI